jgi:hypothetical protein
LDSEEEIKTKEEFKECERETFLWESVENGV